jgi:hypothetical protein
MHIDTTTHSFEGSYEDENGASKSEALGDRDGDDEPVTITITHGHSKDHRADCKQVVHELLVTSDGDVPLMFKAWSGNASDVVIMQERIKKLKEELANASAAALFPEYFVGDSKLYCQKSLEDANDDDVRRQTVAIASTLLLLTALVAAATPIGVIPVSVRSQFARFVTGLEKAGALQAGRWESLKSDITPALAQEIDTALQWLYDHEAQEQVMNLLPEATRSTWTTREACLEESSCVAQTWYKWHRNLLGAQGIMAPNHSWTYAKGKWREEQFDFSYGLTFGAPFLSEIRQGSFFAFLRCDSGGGNVSLGDRSLGVEKACDAVVLRRGSKEICRLSGIRSRIQKITDNRSLAFEASETACHWRVVLVDARRTESQEPKGSTTVSFRAAIWLETEVD